MSEKPQMFREHMKVAIGYTLLLPPKESEAKIGDMPLTEEEWNLLELLIQKPKDGK